MKKIYAVCNDKCSMLSDFNFFENKKEAMLGLIEQAYEIIDKAKEGDEYELFANGDLCEFVINGNQYYIAETEVR